MKDLFINFLKEYKLYYRFIGYHLAHPLAIEGSFEEYFLKCKPVSYLFDAFDWSKTDEGSSFWKEMSKCWDEYREKHGKWKYKITFESRYVSTEELYEDISKYLSQKYGIETEDNLEVFEKEL